MYDRSSYPYQLYEQLVQWFGDDEFVLIAIKTSRKASDHEVLQAVRRITKELSEFAVVVDVVSITSLYLPGTENGVFGVYPLTRGEERPALLDDAIIRQLRKKWSTLGLLLSEDLHTVGIIVWFDRAAKSDSNIDEFVSRVKTKVVTQFPGFQECHASGLSLLRVAAHKYIIRTVFTITLLSVLMALLVAAYVFKQLGVVFIVSVVSSTSIIWALGLVSLAGLTLHMTTIAFFGLLFVVSTTTVFHLVAQFNKRFGETGDKLLSVRHAIDVAGAPCVMSVITTAIGFGSMMLSPIKAVQISGLVISTGLIASLIAALTLIPTVLLRFKTLDRRVYQRIPFDLMSRSIEFTRKAVFRYPRSLVLFISAFAVIPIVGFQWIGSIPHPKNFFGSSTPEAVSLRFIENNLSSLDSVFILVQSQKNAFKSFASLKQLKFLEDDLKKIPEVQSIDSILPVIEDLYRTFGGSQSIFTSPSSDSDIILQVFFLIGSTAQGKALVHRYIGKDYDTTRLSVQLGNLSSGDLTKVLDEIQLTARSRLADLGQVDLTGHLVLDANLSSDLVSSQILSLFVSALIIILLMFIQLRSLTLGVLSIIPNILPMLVIFGMMGWFGIPLDVFTVFTAAICLGLAVDDTIHFMTHLKREMVFIEDPAGVPESLEKVYAISARAMVSTSVVLFCAFIPYWISPFMPAVNFGVLCATGVAVALIGDLILLPSVILSSDSIQLLIQRMRRHRR
jgi:hypothetical protein